MAFNCGGNESFLLFRLQLILVVAAAVVDAKYPDDLGIVVDGVGDDGAALVVGDAQARRISSRAGARSGKLAKVSQWLMMAVM